MPDIILIDTDILIDAGRKAAEAVSYLEHAEQHAVLGISLITQMELLVGCRNKSELNSLVKFLRVSKLSAWMRVSLREASICFENIVSVMAFLSPIHWLQQQLFPLQRRLQQKINRTINSLKGFSYFPIQTPIFNLWHCVPAAFVPFFQVPSHSFHSALLIPKSTFLSLVCCLYFYLFTNLPIYRLTFSPFF